MFGLGMSELLVIFVVALLFLGPEKLPDAAKKLSQGIREFREHGRELQRTLDEDTELGSVVRDLKSALRGDEIRSAIAQYEHPEDSVARLQPDEEEKGPVERESSRRGAASAGEDTDEGAPAVDPYELRGQAVRAAAAERAHAESASGSTVSTKASGEPAASDGGSEKPNA